MNKIVLVQLQWKYSPATYLEGPILIKFEGGTLEIKDGVALTEIDPEFFHADQSIRDVLTKRIENRLHAVQITTHKNFELSKSSRTDLQEDGRKHHFLEVDSCVMTASVGSVDLIAKDKDGNVISDAKKERLEKQSNFASLFDKHGASDATLDHMLKSYQQAVNDPSNELVHLYEIRDALSKKFGSKKAAIVALCITSDEWDEIGRVANFLPLEQGRHRGKAVGSLRSAEPAELGIARKSVILLIEKYLEFLEV